MNISSLIQTAKENGFIQVDDGARTWDLDQFGSAMWKDSKDYALNYDGSVHEYNEHGYQNSIACFTFLEPNKTFCPCCSSEGKSTRHITIYEIEERAIRVDDQGRLQRFCDHCNSQYAMTDF